MMRGRGRASWARRILDLVATDPGKAWTVAMLDVLIDESETGIARQARRACIASEVSRLKKEGSLEECPAAPSGRSVFGKLRSFKLARADGPT